MKRKYRKQLQATTTATAFWELDGVFALKNGTEDFSHAFLSTGFSGSFVKHHSVIAAWHKAAMCF